MRVHVTRCRSLYLNHKSVVLLETFTLLILSDKCKLNNILFYKNNKNCNSKFLSCPSFYTCRSNLHCLLKSQIQRRSFSYKSEKIKIIQKNIKFNYLFNRHFIMYIIINFNNYAYYRCTLN